MNGARTGTFFFGPAPWGGAKRSNIIMTINFNYKVNFKDFKPIFVCLFTNERYKTFHTGFLFSSLGHAPGVGLGGTVGGWRGQKKFFSEIQPDLVCEFLT